MIPVGSLLCLDPGRCLLINYVYSTYIVSAIPTSYGSIQIPAGDTSDMSLPSKNLPQYGVYNLTSQTTHARAGAMHANNTITLSLVVFIAYLGAKC